MQRFSDAAVSQNVLAITFLLDTLLQCLFLLLMQQIWDISLWQLPNRLPKGHSINAAHFSFYVSAVKEEYVATFKGSEFFCYDLSLNPIQSSSDEITLSFKTLQRNGLMLHTGKSADYVNLALKNGAVSLVINLGSGAFEALVEPVNGKFNDNDWHDVKVTRNLRQVTVQRMMQGLNESKQMHLNHYHHTIYCFVFSDIVIGSLNWILVVLVEIKQNHKWTGTSRCESRPLLDYSLRGGGGVCC